MKISMHILGLVLLTLTGLASASTGRHFDHQPMNKAIEWAGEIPNAFMQETNLSLLREFRDQMKSAIDEGRVPQAEGQTWLLAADELIAYHLAISDEWGKGQTRLSVDKALTQLWKRQIELRKKMISHFQSLLSIPDLSLDSYLDFVAFCWEALATLPRTRPSPAQLNNMKQELGDWLTLSRTLLEKAPALSPQLQNLIYEKFRIMLARGVAENLIFQEDLLDLLPLFSENARQSVRLYAAYDAFAFRSNLALRNPRASLRVDDLFPTQVRYAYDVLLRSHEARGDFKEFLRTEVNSVDWFVHILNDLVKGGSKAGVDAEVSQLSRDGLRAVSEIAELNSVWNFAPEKAFFQHLQLMAKFTVLIARQENVRKPKTTRRAFGATYEQFMQAHYIVSSFKTGALKDTLPPTYSRVMIKALADFVPLLDSLGGLDQATVESLTSAFAEFRIKMPHDYHLTKLARYLFAKPELPPELRLDTLRYLKNSGFGGDELNSAGIAVIEHSLQQKVNEELSRYWVIRAKYADEGFAVAAEDGTIGSDVHYLDLFRNSLSDEAICEVILKD